MKARSLAAVLTLLAMGWLNVDKVEARYFGGYRGFYGGYRGFYGGFRGFYGRGFYGGFYRPWFRPWYGGYYAGFYRPWLYPNYYGGGYWPGYYAQPYYGGYFNNCYLSDLSYGGYAMVSPPDLSPDGTFAYNGGPEKLSPLPDISPAPAKTQWVSREPNFRFLAYGEKVPPKTAVVSQAAPKTPALVYPAYGEQPIQPAALVLSNR